MFSNPLTRRFRRRHNNNTAENNNDNPCGSPPSRQPPPPEQAPPSSPSSIRRPPPLVPNISPSSSRYLSPATEAMLQHHHGNHSNSNNNNGNESSQEEELQHLDRDGHLEELRHIWKDYVQERERQVLSRNNNKDNDPAELVLAEVELNRTGVKYLMEQAQVLLLHAANSDDAILPTRLLLNSCRYRETDQTAHLLVRGYLAQCLPRLQLLRLEAAYVGHLPQATAECLLQGLLAKPSLQHLTTLQLVDWDLRPPPVADKLAALLSPLPSELSSVAAAEAEPNGLLRLETLELRHCRVTPHTLTRLGHALTTMSPSAHMCYCPLQRLTLHACVLDDALLDVLVRALKRSGGDNGEDETSSASSSSSSSATLSQLRHLALPSNRLTVASLSNLAKLLDRLPHLQTLNVERISRLFFVPPPPSNPDIAINHDNNDNDIDNRQDVLETGVALFSTALSNHAALQLLDLTRCGATDLVANALFRSLPNSLQELRLGGNDLTTDTAVHELSGLRHLQRLELPHAALDWYRGTNNNNDDANSNIGSYKSALAHALHQNTSLTSVLCDGTLLVDALPVMHRNHYLRHVQTLLMLSPSLRMTNSTEKKKGDSIPATTSDDINNNDNINPSDNVLDAHSPLWPHALHACRTAEGSSARYAVLQMHAVHWAT